LWDKSPPCRVSNLPVTWRHLSEERRTQPTAAKARKLAKDILFFISSLLL